MKKLSPNTHYLHCNTVFKSDVNVQQIKTDAMSDQKQLALSLRLPPGTEVNTLTEGGACFRAAGATI